jgi:succinoglycan biosynthesis transport protein ExoP
MDKQRIAQALRRWGWLIPVAVLLVSGISFGVSRVLPPSYVATATLLVQPQASSVSGPQYNDYLAGQQLARTYEKMILTDPVLEQVIAGLELTATPSDLMKRLSTKVLRDTQLIQVSAEDRDPQVAQRLANLTAQTFMEQNRRLQVGSLATSKDNLARQIAKMTSEIDSSSGMIDRLRATVVAGTGTPQDTITLQQLQTQVSQTQVTYSSLLKTMQELELSEGRAAESVRLIEPAALPLRPARPNVPLNTLAGLLVGLIGSLGLIALLQYADDTLKTSEDANRALGLPVLATLTQFRNTDDRTSDLVTATAPRSAASESYRTLRTNLQFSTLDAPVRSIVVTSAASRDGKSTVASNLAVALAQAGNRVLLVDGDLRRPSLHRLFEVSNRHGLTDLLLDTSRAIDEVALETSMPGLYVIPSGPQPPNPSEVLGSPRMRRVLGEMCEWADLVVLDSPPALAVADGVILSAIADGTLLVVRSGSTRRSLSQRVKEQLDHVGARLLGVVVNAAPRHSLNDGYYASYYVERDDAPGPRQDRGALVGGPPRSPQGNLDAAAAMRPSGPSDAPAEGRAGTELAVRAEALDRGDARCDDALSLVGGLHHPENGVATAYRNGHTQALDRQSEAQES